MSSPNTHYLYKVCLFFKLFPFPSLCHCSIEQMHKLIYGAPTFENGAMTLIPGALWNRIRVSHTAVMLIGGDMFTYHCACTCTMCCGAPVQLSCAHKVSEMFSHMITVWVEAYAYCYLSPGIIPQDCWTYTPLAAGCLVALSRAPRIKLVAYRLHSRSCSMPHGESHWPLIQTWRYISSLLRSNQILPSTGN